MVCSGREACDGRIEKQRCTQRWALSSGPPMPAAYAVSRLPRLAVAPDLSRTLGRVATVLSARSMVGMQIRDLRKMAELSDRLVAPSQWVFSALAANGVPAEKIFVSRQAVADSFVSLGAAAHRTSDPGTLRIGFVGRLEPYKGPHVLLEAMKLLPRDLPVKLIVAGSGTEPPYLRTLEAAAAGDDRIEFLGSISHGQLPDFLKRIDILAVPSNYMETGPLVVLEAFAFGIPVMGANLGGIAEQADRFRLAGLRPALDLLQRLVERLCRPEENRCNRHAPFVGCDDDERPVASPGGLDSDSAGSKGFDVCHGFTA